MTDRGPQSGTGLYAAMLGILVLASFFAVLGNAPLFDVDEGAFSEATREMAASGNYLTTYLNGAPRLTNRCSSTGCSSSASKPSD